MDFALGRSVNRDWAAAGSALTLLRMSMALHTSSHSIMKYGEVGIKGGVSLVEVLFFPIFFVNVRCRLFGVLGRKARVGVFVQSGGSDSN